MTELVERPQSVALTNEQLQYIANTEFVPRGLRGNLPAILACVATGREVGVGDLTAIRNINVIEGKPSFSAEFMVMLVRRAGHSITGSVDDGEAIVKGRRKDNGDEMTVKWTLAMAKRAELTGKGNWKKYPEAMLWARGVSQLCRMLFADVFAGGTYTAEELGAELTDEHGALIPEVLPTGEIVEGSVAPSAYGDEQPSPKTASSPAAESPGDGSQSLSPGDVLIPAGKHEGQSIRDVYRVAPGYIQQVARVSKNPEMKAAAQAWLAEVAERAEDPSIPF